MRTTTTPAAARTGPPAAAPTIPSPRDVPADRYEPGHLTHGWEPDLDPGDTLARRFLLHYADYLVAAAVASGGRVMRRDDVIIADAERPAGYFNSVVLLQPPRPDSWDRTLDDIERICFRRPRSGTGPTGDVLLWSLWPTPDLRERAWDLAGHPPLLFRPPGGPLPEPAAGLRLEPVHDRRGLAEWRRVAVEGYPLEGVPVSGSGALLGPAVLSDPRWRLWVGYEDDRPVSIGTLFTAHGLAQPALGVTLPSARGRGYWSTQMRARLLAEPALPSAGLFSDDSRSGAERLGYLPLFRLTLWRRPRPTR
jgi:hypothetical protein